MKTIKTIRIVPLMLLPLLFTGCASIVDGGPKTVRVNSDPTGAKVTIFDRDGNEVYVEKTPVTVRLERSASFFKGQNYKFVFEKPGYDTREMYVMSSLDDWTLGNFILGGLVGVGVVIDGATGDMFTLSPRQLTCTLPPSEAPLTTENSPNAESKAVSSQ